MTPKEAINCIKDVLGSDYHYDETLGYQLTSDDFEWLELASKALEKQIEKKPKMWSEKSEWSLVPFELPFGDWGYECPCCGNRDIDHPEHHCKCGQALKWGEEE